MSQRLCHRGFKAFQKKGHEKIPDHVQEAYGCGLSSLVRSRYSWDIHLDWRIYPSDVYPANRIHIDCLRGSSNIFEKIRM